MEKSSFDYLWELLAPAPVFGNVKDRCRALWNSRSLQWQRRVYYTLREQKRRGEPFKENPYYTLSDCTPHPTDWNGRPGINDMMKRERMVIAFYEGRYGTYTAKEAQLFEMTNVKSLN